MIRIDTTEVLGAAIRAERKRLGLTQSQLAMTAGVGLRFIVELEAGKPTVRLAKVLRTIDALGGEFNLAGLSAYPSSALAADHHAQ